MSMARKTQQPLLMLFCFYTIHILTLQYSHVHTHRKFCFRTIAATIVLHYGTLCARYTLVLDEKMPSWNEIGCPIMCMHLTLYKQWMVVFFLFEFSTFGYLVIAGNHTHSRSVTLNTTIIIRRPAKTILLGTLFDFIAWLYGAKHCQHWRQ